MLPDVSHPATDVKLARVIASIESSNNPHAMRFEPAVYKEYTNDPLPRSPSLLAAVCRANGECSDATGNCILSTSYGLYQLMGENLYSLGYRGSVVDFMCGLQTQFDYFAAFLDSKTINTTLDALIKSQPLREYFAEKYNGSSAYASKILATAQKMGLVR